MFKFIIVLKKKLSINFFNNQLLINWCTCNAPSVKCEFLYVDYVNVCKIILLYFIIAIFCKIKTEFIYIFKISYFIFIYKRLLKFL